MNRREALWAMILGLIPACLFSRTSKASSEQKANESKETILRYGNVVLRHVLTRFVRQEVVLEDSLDSLRKWTIEVRGIVETRKSLVWPQDKLEFSLIGIPLVKSDNAILGKWEMTPIGQEYLKVEARFCCETRDS